METKKNNIPVVHTKQERKHMGSVLKVATFFSFWDTTIYM